MGPFKFIGKLFNSTSKVVDATDKVVIGINIAANAVPLQASIMMREMLLEANMTKEQLDAEIAYWDK